MIIEGKNVVFERLKSGATVNKVMVAEGNQDGQTRQIIAMAREEKIPVQYLNKFAFKKLAQTQQNQGVLAEVVDFEYSTIEEIVQDERKFVVILDEISDPHNFGAIIRSCEIAGVSGIVIPLRRACPVNETVVKTSAGAIANVKIARVTNLSQEIEKLKKEGFWVYACEAGGKCLWETNLTGSVAIVVGSEGFGVSQNIKNNADEIVSIPMRGKINSLNASVACGIVLAEVVRQTQPSTK